MEEQIKKLIHKYEALIQYLKTTGRNDVETFNNNISIHVYERVINDLKIISDKTKDENKL